ncbi:uncharacterized protein F5891DRAFT_1256818 [Suillus fuscotomentosus]|uniref:Protein kinase domain-containing protein n=1 Tax=Suillus fuscotomentosus TaxID=1912939 RepID=A0AAD4HF46_9AGAM|nr:uncharacterized protein F5891DRAFT_1256818 [Suillus fuscotomentosus]KAG1893891.1 hypothetical protein F5891DRAFT_1256818 [Suillus fuscotomentosus]
MHNIIHKANEESSQSGLLNPLPFNVVPEPRYWSSEFATTPIPDATDSCKPDLVLMDFRLKKNESGEKTWADVLTNIEITKSELVQGKDIPIFLGVTTKGYLIMREQPWRCFVVLFSIANLQLHAHYMDCSGMIISQPLPINSNAVHFVDVLNAITLSDLPSLGFDPTIHVCTDLCSTDPHNDLPEGIDHMPEGTKGWVMDNDSEVYWIMALLWKSRGPFSHGTVCYWVQDWHGTEFTLKDCWVDAENLDHEVTLLHAVDGIPNVVSLKKYWDVQYAGQTDCTERIREHISENLPESPIYSNKVHRRMLLTPCGLLLTTFKSLPELVNVFRDLIIAHEAIVTQQNVLHGDLSPNNIIIHDGKGYFIDFNHAKFLKNNAAVNSRGTLMGDIPRPSMIDHRASDDLESLFYILLEFTTTYEGPSGKASVEGVHPVNAPRWRKAYLMMDGDGLGTSGSLKKEFLTEKHPPYELTPYFRACRPILEEWRKAIEDVLRNEHDLSHNEILKIMQQGLERILSSLGTATLQSIAFLPVTSVATPSPTSLPLPVRPHHPTSLPPASLPPPPIEAMTQDAVAPSASGSMISSFHSSSPPPTSGPMTRLQPRHSGQKNKMILPPLPSLPSVGPNELPGSGAGSMTEELPTSFLHSMPPRKRARQGSPGDKSRKGAKVARANVDPTRRSSRSTRGISGHAAQLQKTGKTLTAPTRRKKASDDLNISDSEENPMALSQLKGRKQKVAASTPKSSVEPDSSRPESERAHLHIARPSDRFGFKPSQSQATHPIGHNHEVAGSEVTEEDLEDHSGLGDLDDFDKWGKSGDGDDLMEFDETQPGHKDERTDTIPSDVLKHHQAKNGRRKAPSPTCLSSNSRGHTLTCNARSKSPHQYSHKHMPRRRSPETHTSSTRLKPPQRAPRKGPSAKAGSAHGLCVQAEVVISPPADHLLIDAPRLSQQLFLLIQCLRIQAGVVIPPPMDHLVDAPQLSQRLSLLAQGLCIQAGVVITLPTDRLLGDSPRLSQQPFSLAQDLHIGVHPVDHLLDIPCCGYHTGEPLNPITCVLIPLFQAILTPVLAVPHLNQEHQQALLLVREVLDAVLWSYHSKKIKMENGYFPQYSTQMSCLLCNDLFTFRTELKKIIISIAKQLYDIFPKANVRQKDAIQQHVTKVASKLIKSGDYLRLPDSSSGKYKNFVSQVLKDACINFYYGNGKKALKLTEEFRKMIPVNALILVSAIAKGILTGFHDTGTDKVPDLSADKCRSDFDGLQKSVDTLMTNPEHRQELESMLEEWADVGMMAKNGGRGDIRELHKELLGVSSVIQSDSLFAKDLKVKTEQAVQDTIVATNIIEGFKNLHQSAAYLKNHASFPLEFFTCVTQEMQEHLQWFKNTIEKIEQKLSASASQSQNTPQD